MNKIEKLKNKVKLIVRNKDKQQEFTSIDNPYSTESNKTTYLIEDSIKLERNKNNKETAYKLYLGDLLILEGKRTRTKKYFVLPRAVINGEYVYLDTLYNWIEHHNSKILNEQLFSSIEVFLNKRF